MYSYRFGDFAAKLSTIRAGARHSLDFSDAARAFEYGSKGFQRARRAVPGLDVVKGLFCRGTWRPLQAGHFLLVMDVVSSTP